MFDDLLTANARFAENFDLAGLSSQAGKKLAVVTCIDTRLDPYRVLGLQPGDAKILRNAGGRVTTDALRSLILATNLLSVERIAVIQHTKCAVGSPPDKLAAALAEAAGVTVEELGDLDLGAMADPDADLRADVQLVRDCPLIPDTVEVVGWRYDVDTGLVNPVVS